MDSLKKIIHPHKTEHHSGDASATHPNTTTTTTSQHSNVLTGSDTGDNIANPFTEPNTTAAEHFRRTHAADTAAEGTNRHGHPTEGARLGRQHDDDHFRDEHRTTATGTHSAGLGSGDNERVPGVSTGGGGPEVGVVGARMPVEEGNNFPGTNPHPAHSALGVGGAGGGGGLKYPGAE